MAAGNVAGMVEGDGSTLLYHDCFSQIDKDLDRTFSLGLGKKRQF